MQFAKDHIQEAGKQVGEGKRYEANLALKAVDDAVVVEFYTIDGIPKTKSRAKD